MGKLIIDLSRLNTINATLAQPVQLRLITQIKRFNQLTGFLTVTNILLSQLSNKKTSSQSPHSHDLTSDEDDELESDPESGYASAAETLPDQSPPFEFQSTPVPSTPSPIPQLEIDLGYIVRDLASNKMNILKSGYVIDVEVFFRGFDEDVMAIDLNDIKEPGLVIEELKTLVEFQDAFAVRVT